MTAGKQSEPVLTGKVFLHDLRARIQPADDDMAYGCDSHTTDDVHEIMLLGEHRGKTYQDDGHKREHLHLPADIAAFPDSQIAERADKTVERREKTPSDIPSVACVYHSQTPVEDSRAFHCRKNTFGAPVYVCGHEEEEQEPDECGDRVRDDEVDVIPAVRGGYDQQINSPEGIRRDVYDDEDLHQRDVVVDERDLGSDLPAVGSGTHAEFRAQQKHQALEAIEEHGHEPTDWRYFLDQLDNFLHIRGEDNTIAVCNQGKRWL